MDKKYDTREAIEMYAKILGFEMDEARKDNLVPAFENMFGKGERVDMKMSKKPYADIVPGNIYIH